MKRPPSGKSKKSRPGSRGSAKNKEQDEDGGTFLTGVSGSENRMQKMDKRIQSELEFIVEDPETKDEFE